MSKSWSRQSSYNKCRKYHFCGKKCPKCCICRLILGRSMRKIRVLISGYDMSCFIATMLVFLEYLALLSHKENCYRSVFHYYTPVRYKVNRVIHHAIKLFFNQFCCFFKSSFPHYFKNLFHSISYVFIFYTSNL